MRRSVFVLAGSVMLACSVSAALAQEGGSGSRASQCPSTGAGSPGERHREWILVGWEKRIGDPPFDFARKLGHLYDWTSSDVFLYDDLAPDHRAVRSAEDYGGMWTPIFRSQREVRHSVVDGPDVIVGDDLATSTLEFAARLENAEGAVNGIRDRSTLVWRCHRDGWRIVREHNSSYPVDRTQIDRLVPVSGER